MISVLDISEQIIHVSSIYHRFQEPVKMRGLADSDLDLHPEKVILFKV